ncbi:MAG: sulfotransferase [bacterium]|nr:sulfotransferase [bacterium]
MLDGQTTAGAHLVGASIPRSGHHFLVDLLTALLGDGIRYCEFYAEAGCCRRIPCAVPTAGAIRFQKHHDLALDLPTDVPGVLYVVQTRDPVMSTLSDREHLARFEGEARAADRDESVLWLGRKASYYQRFVEKWVHRPPAAHLHLPYDDLVADPAAALRQLTAACGVEVDDARLAAAVGAVAGHRAAPAEEAPERFTRRRRTDSPYLDAELLAAFESLLCEHLPELRPGRLLADVDHRRSPVTPVYEAEQACAAGDLLGALGHLDAARALEPRNRYLLGARADLLARLGRLDEAIAAATSAAELEPGDALALRRVSNLHVRRTMADLVGARAVAERLVALRPDDAGDRVHLASICMRLGDRDAAVGHARRALSAGARDAFVWRYASEVLATFGQLEAALAAVQGGIERSPFVGEFHHHAANLLTGLGRPGEAAAAHRRALELEPDQPHWHWKYVEDLLRAGATAEAEGALADALARFPADRRLVAQRARL